MKKLTCKDFGGPCDAEITGNSFQEMGNNSRMHVIEKIKGGDAAHKAAADKMRNASQEEQMAMMAEYEKNSTKRQMYKPKKIATTKAKRSLNHQLLS
jgi:hypothetical protein